MTTAEELDTPIHRATINELPIDTLDIMLMQIRERRLAWVSKLEATEKAKKEAADEKLIEKYTKLYSKVHASITKLDASIEKIEIDINKLRAIALELEG